MKMRFILLYLFFVILLLMSCKESSSEKDNLNVIFALNKYIERPFYSEAKPRASKALSTWENGIIDHEPILIFSFLRKVLELDDSYSDFIVLGYYDEDKDILGFGIREKHISSEKQITFIEETYPAHVHEDRLKNVVSGTWIPVDLRIEGKYKDELEWDKFINGDNIDWNQPWDKIVPPMCVSVPEPDKIEVWVWVYDRAGNKSEPIKLINISSKK